MLDVLGVKQTSVSYSGMSLFDPLQTLPCFDCSNILVL